jgi:flagellum-specific ATP synthase
MLGTMLNSNLATWQRYLKDCTDQVQAVQPLSISGRLTRVAGMVMETVGLKLPVGSACQIVHDGRVQTEAEVVGFSGDKLFLMPVQDVYGLAPGATVYPIYGRHCVPVLGHHRNHAMTSQRVKHLPVGFGLLGRVLDATGEPLDSLGPIVEDTRWPLQSRLINPLGRAPISEALDVGVRAINSLLTVGRGQRMGLFAGSGVGKSVLLAMMARYTAADVIVVGLIGERGREVKEFIENILGTEGLRRSVVIAAPADTPPLLRLQGASYATAMAEYFRDQGKQVLLLMDSLTRFAMAQREIALAVGEAPATKGYPPSVFARLPQLVERAGNGSRGQGSITAFYTVLTEGDDQQDPIADAARAILDGHIVLSRSLAEQGHYPAIDIEASISRVLHSVATPKHLSLVKGFKQLYARYQRNRDLINVGAYVHGSDPLLDQAIVLFPKLESYLQQDITERATFPQSITSLSDLLNIGEARADAVTIA